MDSTKNKNILIADDHFVVRSGLELLISNRYIYSTLSFASKFDELFSLIEKKNFDLLILDANFPEGNSLSIIEKVFKLQPELNIIIYTALDEKIFAQQFLKLGVKGYLNKLAKEDEIFDAIDTVLRGDLYLNKETKALLMDQMMSKQKNSSFELLSQREFEIMLLMVKGEANLEISNRLNIKPSTISTFKNRIFSKLQVDNLSELIELYTSYEKKL